MHEGSYNGMNRPKYSMEVLEVHEAASSQCFEHYGKPLTKRRDRDVTI